MLRSKRHNLEGREWETWWFWESSQSNTHTILASAFCLLHKILHHILIISMKLDYLQEVNWGSVCSIRPQREESRRCPSLRMSVPKCKYCTLRSFCLCAWPISWENEGHGSPSDRLTLTLTKLQVCGTKIQPLTTPKYRRFFFLSLQRWLFGK